MTKDDVKVGRNVSREQRRNSCAFRLLSANVENRNLAYLILELVKYFPMAFMNLLKASNVDVMNWWCMIAVNNIVARDEPRPERLTA